MVGAGSLLALNRAPVRIEPHVWIDARWVWEIRGADVTLSPVRAMIYPSHVASMVKINP